MTKAAQRIPRVDGAVRSGGPAALFSCSSSGTLVAVGPSLGVRPGEPAHAAVHPSSVARLDAALQDARAGLASGTTSLRLACGSGGDLTVAWSAMTGAEPESTQVVFVSTGPATRHTFRPSLRLQEAVDRLSREVAIVVDGNGALLHASPSAPAVLGAGVDGDLPADIWGAVHPDDAAWVRGGLRTVVDREEARTATLRVRGTDGGWRWVEVAAVSLRDDAIGGVACALHDITAEVDAKQAARAAEARFRALAALSADGVCVVGLAGETLYANSRLAEILGMPMSPGCYVDLMCTLEEAHGRGEITSVHPDGTERRLLVAAAPLSAPDGTPEGSLVTVSEVAGSEHDVQIAEEPDGLATDLRTALDDDALHVEYQPIVDLRSGAVVGMEALARWTHPERGEVPPARFVAVAESTGVAPQLDRWSVRRALRDMGALRAAGVVPEEAYVAVNLSACSVTGTFGVEELLGWVADAGLPPRQLVLEITETAIMRNADEAIRLLRRLREHGIRVAMDDFGTGYSSLAYLRDLPISALKIDRSFVADLPHHPDARAIVASVVALARAVGVAVVAEGVETAIQAAILQQLGCAHGQGWLWSRSVPVTALLEGDRWDSLLPSTGEPHDPTHENGERDTGVAHGLRRLFELHQDGAAVATIVATLDAEGFRTPGGRRWHRSSVARVIAQRIRRYSGAHPSAGARVAWRRARP